MHVKPEIYKASVTASSCSRVPGYQVPITNSQLESNTKIHIEMSGTKKSNTPHSET